MRDDLPSVTIAERITGTGVLVEEGREYPCDRFELERRLYDPESEWLFRAFVATSSHARGREAFPHGYSPVSFQGRDERGRAVSVERLHLRGSVHRQSLAEFTAISQSVAIGTARLNGRCARQIIAVHLWPTELVEPEVPMPARAWTGELKSFGRGAAPKPRRVRVSLGGIEFRLSMHYEWDDVAVEGKKSVLRVPRPTLSAVIRGRSCAAEPQELMRRVERDLGDLLSVISFASRRFVRWSRFTIQSELKTGPDAGFHEFKVVSGSRSVNYDKGASHLLHGFAMPEDWPAKLLGVFQSLSKKEVIAAAIHYLIAAQHATFIEEALSSAYTAFESTLSALSDPSREHSLGSSKYRRLAAEVRATIESFCEKNGVSSEDRDAIVAKLPELRRRPILRRAMECFAEMRIDLSDLWSHDKSALDEFGALLQRRNAYIHTGQLGGIDEAIADKERLIAITERLVMSSLNVQRTWLSPFAEDRIKFLAYLHE
jgi:hypothetical protein